MEISNVDSDDSDFVACDPANEESDRVTTINKTHKKNTKVTVVPPQYLFSDTTSRGVKSEIRLEGADETTPGQCCTSFSDKSGEDKENFNVVGERSRRPKLCWSKQEIQALKVSFLSSHWISVLSSIYVSMYLKFVFWVLYRKEFYNNWELKTILRRKKSHGFKFWRITKIYSIRRERLRI